MYIKRTAIVRSSAWISFALLTAAALFFSGAAAAQNQAPWPVKEKLLGDKDKKSEDVSGIACTSASGFPRTCLAVDDNVQGAQLVIVRDGELTAGQFIPLIDNVFEGKPLELDGEGVGYTDGFYYVMGSHGHPRDKKNKLDPVKDEAKIKASIEASSQIIRLKIDPASVDGKGKLTTPPEIKSSAAFRNFLAAEPSLKTFMDQRLDKNGLTIEGVAVRDGRLFAGMRGPLLDNNRAAVFSVALDSLFGSAAPDPKLKKLDLGGRGVRDLVAFEKGFLVLAGPSPEAEGNYAVYAWDGETVGEHPAELPRFNLPDGDQAKPEALLPLDRTSDGLRVLVLFDGAEEGAPRALTIPLP